MHTSSSTERATEVRTANLLKLLWGPSKIILVLKVSKQWGLPCVTVLGRFPHPQPGKANKEPGPESPDRVLTLSLMHAATGRGDGVGAG